MKPRCRAGVQPSLRARTGTGSKPGTNGAVPPRSRFSPIGRLEHRMNRKASCAFFALFAKRKRPVFRSYPSRMPARPGLGTAAMAGILLVAGAAVAFAFGMGLLVAALVLALPLVEIALLLVAHRESPSGGKTAAGRGRLPCALSRPAAAPRRLRPRRR